MPELLFPSPYLWYSIGVRLRDESLKERSLYKMEGESPTVL